MLYELNVGKFSVMSLPTDPSKKSELSGTVNTVSTEVKRVVILDRLTFAIVGSCIVNDDNTWKVKGYFTTDQGLVALCFDEGGEFNADVYDLLSMGTVIYTHGTEWNTALEKTGINYGKIISPSTYANSLPWDSTISIEDIKSSIAKFQFDTIGVSGHFEDSSNVPVTIGDGNTVSKVNVGSFIEMDGEVTDITGVTDDGESDNETVITSVNNGQSYVYDIYGDGSCVFMAPLDRDVETESVSRLYKTRNLLWKQGKFSKSLGITTPQGVKDAGIIYPEFKLTDGDYTFSFWVNQESPNNCVFLHQNYAFSLQYQSGFSIKVNRSASLNTIVPHTYAPSFTAGVWYHMIVSVGASGCTIWKDGESVYTSATNSSIIQNIASEHFKENRLSLLATETFGISSSFGADFGNYLYRISHVRIFNKRITLPADAQTLYNEVPSPGGVRDTTSISNLRKIHTNIYQAPKINNNYSTFLIEPKVKTIPYLKGDSIESVEPILYEEGKFQTGFLKGNGKTAYSFVSNEGSVQYGFADYAASGGYHWYFSMLLNDLDKKNHYFIVRFPKKYRLTGISFKRTITYEHPIKFYIYTSESGAFKGEEIFCGEEVFIENPTLAADAHTEMFKFKNLVIGKYVKFYITGRSSIVTNLSSAANVGFQNVYFEIAVPLPTEARKARSIVIDVADCWGSTTYMGARAFCPMLNGEFISLDGWTFYQTSYEVGTSKADRCFDPKYSHRDADVVGTYWRTASGQYTNQRVIAVAPKDFYFDDIFFLNYHSSGVTNVTYGVKNIKIRSTLSVITDTTYNAAIAGEETVFIGQVPKMYASATEMTHIASYDFCIYPRDIPMGLLGDKRKSVKVRSLAFDFPSSYGSTVNLGVRRIEFWNKGVRYYQNAGGTWTYGATSTVTSGNASYAFACNGVLYDGTVTTSWLSASGQYTNQRLTILFPVEIEIDNIRICNYMLTFGVDIDKGVVGVTVFASLDSSSPSTTYNNSWTGSYELVPYTKIMKRLYYESELWSVIPVVPRKSNTWSARSVVFDIHNNYGGSFTGLQGLRFLNKNLTLMYQVGWSVLSSSSETGYEALNAVSAYLNWITGCAVNQSWKTLQSTSRIVVLFDDVTEFDTINVSNWWLSPDYNSVLCGVKDVTVTITNSILGVGDAVYNQAITGGTVIFDSGVPSRQPYTLANSEYWDTICTKDSIYYSTDIALLIHSNTTNGSVTFTDSSISNHPISAIGTITHSTTQQKIGTSSIVTSAGYLYGNTFKKHHIEARGFEFGIWIYPTATTGDKGLISKWGVTGDLRAFCLSINAGKLEFKYSTDGTAVTTCTSTADVSADAWTWIGVKRNGASLYLIINGSVDSTFTIGTSTIFHSNYRLEIGSFNGDVANCFAGYLDEILVKLDGLQNNTSFTPVTDYISVTPSWSGVTFKGLFAFSFNVLQETFSVWKSGAWRPIISKNDTVHGDTGSSAWHFRDNANAWSLTGIDNNALSAMSKAVEQGTNNQNTSTDVIAITAANWVDTGGFDDGTFDVACTLWKGSADCFFGLTDLKVNNKKYWFSTPIDLSKITGTIVSSSINWLLKKDWNNETLFDDYFSRFKVYAFITGDTEWSECTRGLPIPGVIEGLGTTGKTLYLKTEFDIDDFKEINLSTEPSLLVEIK